MGRLLHECEAQVFGKPEEDKDAARYWRDRLLSAIEAYPDDPETPTAILEVVWMGVGDSARCRELLHQAIDHPHVKPPEKALMLDRVWSLDGLVGGDIPAAFDDLNLLAETIDQLPPDLRWRYDSYRYTIPLKKALLLATVARGKPEVLDRLPPEDRGKRPSDYYREYLETYRTLPPDVRQRAHLPPETHVLDNLALALARQGQTEEAAEIYEDLRSRPDYEVPLATSIKAEAEAIDPKHGEEYLRILKRYERQYAADPQTHRDLAAAIGIWAGVRNDAETCIAELEPVLHEIETHGEWQPLQPLRPTVLLLLGNSYLQGPAADPATAIDRYETLLADYPDSKLIPQALYGLVRAYKLAGDPSAAKEYLDELLTGYPDSPYAAAARREHGE